jgi:hypothetical protein
MSDTNLRSLGLEQLVGLYAALSSDAKAYTELGLEVPKDLTKRLADIKRRVDELKRDEAEKKLATLKLRRDALRTPDEKRSALDAEIAALEQGLK